MDFNYSDRLIFTAEWYQVEASMARAFYLYYFPCDNSFEIFDHKTKRTFLKRITIPHIKESDLYIGSNLNIFGRQIRILDYGDTLTKNRHGHKKEKIFAILKPTSIPVMGKIFKIILSNHIYMNQCKMINISSDEARELYKDFQGDSILPFLVDHLRSGPILAMELILHRGVDVFKTICGPKNPDEARKTAPESIRALYGIDEIRNAIYYTSDKNKTEENIEFFFPPPHIIRFSATVSLKQSTLCIIKPHALKDEELGNILTAIVDAKFKITALKMIFMEKINCEEFYEVYKGVVPEYPQMVEQLNSGPCIALEISSNDPAVNTYDAFRKLCGPVDPTLAKQLRPHTLRARFGVSKACNAVHCTDLEEDTLLEIEYFFKILP